MNCHRCAVARLRLRPLEKGARRRENDPDSSMFLLLSPAVQETSPFHNTLSQFRIQCSPARERRDFYAGTFSLSSRSGLQTEIDCFTLQNLRQPRLARKSSNLEQKQTKGTKRDESSGVSRLSVLFVAFHSESSNAPRFGYCDHLRARRIFAETTTALPRPTHLHSTS